MKKTIFATIVAIFFSVLMFEAKSDSESVAKKWETVSQYEKKSQPESALKEVNSIYEYAIKEKNEGQIIKCLIYQLRLSNEKYGNERTPELIAEIEKLISNGNLSESGNALLHLIAADLYQNYKMQHTFKSRTALADYIPEDISEWPENLFDQKTEEHQNAALAINEKTRRTDIRLFSEALVLGESSRELRPTLFDFICWHIIETKNVKFDDPQLKCLAPTDVFMISDLQKHKTLTVFQQLLKYHQDDRTLTLYCESERLRYGYENLIKDGLSSTENTKLIYLDRLAELEEKYADLDFSCEVALERANQYMNQYSYFENDERHTTATTENPYYEKAYEICQNAIKRHPDYKRINALKNCCEQIKHQQLLATTNEIHYPNEDFEITIHHKNAASAILKVYRIGSDIQSYAEKKMKSARDCVSDRSNLVFEKKISFDDLSEFRLSDTTLTLKLDCGIYEFVVAENEAKTRSNIASTFYITKYELLKRNIKNGTEIYVLDRKTGKPQPNVKVSIFIRNNNSEHKLLLKSEKASDNNGHIIFTTNDADIKKYYGSFEYFISCDNDKYYPGINNYYYYSESRQETEKKQTEIFTDRKIYRPGQIVYFKTVTYSYTKNASKVTPERSFTITLYDGNHKAINSQKLTTNEYGSASGNFVLPKDILPGQFSLKCDNSSLYFSVEEYKRPKFEITFDDIKEEYVAGDTVVLYGHVKTYAGNAASKAKVTYKTSNYKFRFSTLNNNGDETLCDQNGDFKIAVSTLKSVFFYTVEATVTDEKGETQSKTFDFNVNENSLSVSFPLNDIIMRENAEDLKISVINCNSFEIAPSALQYEILQKENIIRQGDIQEKTLTKSVFEQLASGKYSLKVTATDKKGHKHSLTKDFHLFSATDKQLTENTTNFFFCPTSSCKAGESFKLYFGTTEKIYALYQIYSDGIPVEISQWIELDNELRTMEIPYKTSYGNNIDIRITFVKNEKIYQNQHALTKDFDIPKFDIQLISFRDKVLPGSNEEWKIRLTENGKPANCEFLGTMYDASLDVFAPNQWHLTAYPRVYPYQRINTWDFKVVTYESASSPFQTKIKAITEFSFDEFIDTYRFHRIGYGGIALQTMRMRGASVRYCNYSKNSAKEETADSNALYLAEEETEAESASNTPSESIAIRSDFAETAFFYPHLASDENGEISFKFKIPESLTRWNFLGLAHTKDVNTQTISREVITQKPFTISANTPRFVLFGDSITITATLSSLAEETIAGNAYLEILDADKNLLSRQKLDFTLNGIENQTLAWDTEIGDKHSSLIFRFIAENEKFSDGEQYEIPVLPNKKVLLETMPFVVKNIGTTSFSFDLFKQNYDKFDHQNFVIEYNNNPVWSAIQAIPFVTPTSENAIANFSAFYTNTIGKQILHSQNFADYIDLLSSDSELQKNEDVKMLSLDQTHYWGDAQDEAAQRVKIKDFFNEENINKNIDSLFNEVLKLQKDNGGFAWFDGMRENRFVTQYICEGLCRLNKVIPLNDKQLNAKKKALGYLQKCFDEEYQIFKKQLPKKDLYVTTAQIYYLYVLCNEKTKLDRESEKYIFNQIKRHWTYFNLYDKALSAIVLNHFGEPNEAKEIIKSLRENADQKNYEMFWPKNVRSFYWNEEPIVTQCAIIEAFETVEPSKDEIEQMKIWLLSQKQTQRWDNDIATINAVRTIISGNKFSTQTDNFKINVGNTTIYPDSTLNIGYVKKSFDKDSITPDLSNISIEKTNDEYAYGCAYWQYTADYDKIENTKGEILNISKKLFIEKADKDGVRLEEISDKKQLSVGDKAVVRITVNVDKDMDFVCINDGFASCFEPKMKLSGFQFSNGVGYYQAIKDNAVQYFFDTLRKGTYVFEYTLFTARAGEYSNGVGEIQCMYAPAFSNHTQGAKITIRK